MCGRFVLKTPPAEIAQHFGITEVPELEPRYNVAPTQEVPIVRQKGDGTRELVKARWGLVPAGGPGPGTGPLLINARSETAAQKAPFRTVLSHRRCLVPVDGFYEWRKLERMRQPYLIDLGGRLFGFAGLWDEWQSRSTKDRLVSFTILTTQAVPVIARIHDRMPVILPSTQYGDWLDSRRGAEDVAALLGPPTNVQIRTTPVSDHVNSAQNDGPECLRESPEPLELDLFS